MTTTTTTTTTTTRRAPRNWQHEPHTAPCSQCAESAESHQSYADTMTRLSTAPGQLPLDVAARAACPRCGGTGIVETGAIHIGSPMTAYGERRVTMINPTERTAYANPYGGRCDPRFDRESPSYVLWFGAYGWTRLHVYAPSLDDALDACVDWLADYAPGELADEYVHDEYKRLHAERVAAGADPDDEDVIQECQEEAESDTTQAGNAGNYVSEWGVALEDPTPAELYAYITGAA